MNRRYAIVALVTAVAAGFLFASSSLQEIFFSITEQAESISHQNAVLVYTIFIVLAALSAMISPFSSAPVVPVAVMIWGVELTTIFLLTGWLLGDVAAYLVGRYAGHPILRVFDVEEKFKKYENYFSERVTFINALLIRLALPAEIGYGFGLLNYNFIKYAAVTIIAETIFAVITVRASDALASLNLSAFISWVAILILIVGTFYYLFSQHQK